MVAGTERKLLTDAEVEDLMRLGEAAIGDLLQQYETVERVYFGVVREEHEVIVAATSTAKA